MFIKIKEKVPGECIKVAASEHCNIYSSVWFILAILLWLFSREILPQATEAWKPTGTHHPKPPTFLDVLHVG